jgi:hypothetical protein
MMNTRHLDILWILLLGATAMTWWIGERGEGGPVATALILGIAGVKSLFVILDFMALRHVQRMWPALVIGWLVLVLALIGIAYRSAMT